MRLTNFLIIFVLLITAVYFAIGNNNRTTLRWLKEHTSWYQKGTNSGWAGFDKVYFISLENRLENVRLASEKLGIKDNAWLLQAFNKNALNIPLLIDINFLSKDFPDAFLPVHHGRVGCYLSHLAVMLDCYNDPNVKTCVIFEDDLYVHSPETTAQITAFNQHLTKLNIDWDMLYLDYCGEVGTGKTYQDIRWLRGASCMHAYVVKKDIISLLIAKLLPMRLPIDDTIRSLMQQDKIIALGPDKAMFFSQDRKNLDSVINPGFFNDHIEIPRFLHTQDTWRE